MREGPEEAPVTAPTAAPVAAGVESEPAPWERRLGEGAKAYAAFERYRLLGPQRSVLRVAADQGRHPSLIRRWCQRHHWVERALAWDSAQAHEVEGLLSHAREQALKRRVEAAEQIERMGLLALRSLITRDPDSGEPKLDNRVRPRDAVALYRLAMDIHRSLPQAAEAPAVTAEKAEQERLRQLSDEELKQVLALLQQRQQKETPDNEPAHMEQTSTTAVD